MSYPVEADFAVLKYSNGDAPETFTVFCGLQNVTVNENVNTNERVSYDCAKPGKVGVTTVRVLNSTWTITGNGTTDIPATAKTRGLLGKHINWQVDLLKEDGTDAADLMGTYAGQGVLTSRNTNLQRGSDSGLEVSIQGEYDLTWTPAA